MKQWLNLSDVGSDELCALIRTARDLKSGDRSDVVDAVRSSLSGRVMGMVFFNASLRTRTSFESGMFRIGGHAVCLNVGGDTWQLEHRDGVVMDDGCAEHVREAAAALSRYCDVLGVRTFAGMNDAADDARDRVIRSFAQYATVPVVNMESANEHPCQGLADRMTIEEKIASPRGKHFVLTWAPHIKALPMAVAHSAVLAAASAGMHVTIAHPPGYDLNADVVEHARQRCDELDMSLTVTHDQRHACSDADVVYVKSWGSAALYGDVHAQTDDFQKYSDWMVTSDHLHHDDTLLMHCLPVRRNVVIADDAMNDHRCVVVDQAENRMWAQLAILNRLLHRPKG